MPIPRLLPRLNPLRPQADIISLDRGRFSQLWIHRAILTAMRVHSLRWEPCIPAAALHPRHDRRLTASICHRAPRRNTATEEKAEIWAPFRIHAIRQTPCPHTPSPLWIVENARDNILTVITRFNLIWFSVAKHRTEK